MAGITGFGILWGCRGTRAGRATGRASPALPPRTRWSLLQAILQELQALHARLAPDEMLKSVAFNNSAATATIPLNGNQIFNGIVWALTGGMVYVYFDGVGNQPDFILTPTTDEKFLPDIGGKTAITFVPQAAVTGTAYLMRY